jgi:hypothetical protein
MLAVGEETLAIALHPSGFHMVVATAEKLLLMNLLSNSIKEFNSISMKMCREVKFSPGGSMFACSVLPGNIFVYNFWTVDCPSNMQLKGHQSRVRAIDWQDDDSGFCTAG